MIRGFRMHLVIEIVQQGGHPPVLFRFAKALGVRCDAGFNLQRVPPETFRFRVLVQNLEGFGARHRLANVRELSVGNILNWQDTTFIPVCVPHLV
jgi:hypothetical protein